MPPEKFGRYVVEAEIGDGAMGRVYRARDPLARRIVAIKTIKSELLTKENSAEYLRRFHREAQAAGGLSHPNLVTVFDLGEGYFVMEYLEGTTLQALLRQQGRIGLLQTLRILGPVSEALDYAHRNGIIHRDIKPGNIMLLPDGRPKIMDFGVAHLASTVMTTAGQMLGSPSYMAPEQIAGEEVTPRADLFALAAVTYEMLTGRRAFEGATVTTVIFKVMNAAPEPPRRWNGDLPAHYDDVFARALAKPPHERFESARAFAAALDLKGLDYALSEALVTGPVERPGAGAAAPAPPTAAKAELAADAAPRGTTPSVAPAAGPAGGETVDLRPGAPPSTPDSLGETPALGTPAAETPVAEDPATAPTGPMPTRSPGPAAAPAAPVAPRNRRPLLVGAMLVAVGVPLLMIFVLLRSPKPSPTPNPASPTLGATTAPAPSPTAAPTSEPTAAPTVAPTRASQAKRPPTPTAAPTPAPTPAPTATPAPVREGELVELTPDVVPPRKLSGQSPDYPRAAARRKLQGSVTVSLIVTETGELVNLTVIETPGKPLSDAVLAALKTWRFQPATKGGVKVRVPWRQTFSFTAQ